MIRITPLLNEWSEPTDEQKKRQAQLREAKLALAAFLQQPDDSKLEMVIDSFSILGSLMDSTLSFVRKELDRPECAELRNRFPSHRDMEFCKIDLCLTLLQH